MLKIIIDLDGVAMTYTDAAISHMKYPRVYTNNQMLNDDRNYGDKTTSNPIRHIHQFTL